MSAGDLSRKHCSPLGSQSSAFLVVAAVFCVIVMCDCYMQESAFNSPPAQAPPHYSAHYRQYLIKSLFIPHNHHINRITPCTQKAP